MTKPNGLHHLAITTADIKTQIAFFSDVLGTELVALYWMHGVKGAWHGFVKLNDHCSIAFVQSPEIPKVAREIGKTHSGNPGAPCAGGAMQHLALNVRDDDELLAMRDRIRSRGINVFGPIDHGFCKSIYFAGPENLSLELSTSTRGDRRAPMDRSGSRGLGRHQRRGAGALQGAGGLRQSRCAPSAAAGRSIQAAHGLSRYPLQGDAGDVRRGLHAPAQRNDTAGQAGGGVNS